MTHKMGVGVLMCLVLHGDGVVDVPCSSQVLAKTFDCSLGGRNFDYRLKDHFVAEIKKKYKVDSSNPRQWLRLLLECDKMKQLMSASTIPVSLNLECYAEDKDVAGRMSR